MVQAELRVLCLHLKAAGRILAEYMAGSKVASRQADALKIIKYRIL